jgi:hypothetical protein
MDSGLRVTAAAGLALMLWTGMAVAQAKPGCDAQGRPMAPERMEGQVVSMNGAQGTLTVRAPDGTTQEFQASKETLQDLKVGDRIEAKLRQAPKCQ